MPAVSATPISVRPISASPISARAVGAAAQTWAELMVADYKTRYLSTGAWLDSNPDIEAELLSRLQPGGYLHTTFGPGGQDKTECDFLLVLQATGNITTQSNTKTGDQLRWDIDGTVSTQNNLPAHTLGAGAGIITVSSTDGWAGLSLFDLSNRPITGDASAFVVLHDIEQLRTQYAPMVGDISDIGPDTTPLLKEYAMASSGLWGSTFKLSQCEHLERVTTYGTPNVTTDIEWFAPLAADLKQLSVHYSGSNTYGDLGLFGSMPLCTHIQVSQTGVTYSGSAAYWPKIVQILADGMVWDQTSIDQLITDIYDQWVAGTYTYATPTLNIGGNNAAPSGTYQAANPPSTPLEKIYAMVNDPNATGYNTWTITYTAP